MHVKKCGNPVESILQLLFEFEALIEPFVSYEILR